MYDECMAKNKTHSSDVNVTAFEILKAVIGDESDISLRAKPAKKPSKPAKNPAAVALGRLGGLKGGKARADRLSPKKRSDIAKKAARKRWGKD